jgi:putative transposase
VLRAPTYYD